MKKQSAFSLKDQLFNHKTVSQLAEWLYQNNKKFPKDAFIEECISLFPNLELKQRITHIATILHRYLPSDYSNAVEHILASLPPELDPNQTDNDFGSFIIAPLGEYVRMYGCSEKYFEISWYALTEITKRFSAEFAVRTFINRFPIRTYAKFEELAMSSNYHQRRLVSEWSRLTLPWAEKITSWSPEQIIRLLNTLYTDPTRYVTRSVANNLNSMSKLYPQVVIKTLQRRHSESKQSPDEFHWIQKHSLRTLLKQWNSNAFAMLRYTQGDYLCVKNLKVSSQVILWEHFEISFDLAATVWILGKCRVEYAIRYLRKNWTHSRAVYKISEFDSTKTTKSFSKRQPIRLMTTRALYPGKHHWQIIVNWKKLKAWSFELYIS